MHDSSNSHPDLPGSSATPADVSPPRGNPFNIVGIGASAGGLEAFCQLLSTLPDDIDMSFVLVQHLDPHHSSQLGEILATKTALPVHTVEHGMLVKPKNVYVIPPNTSMVLDGDSLKLARREPGLHLPIDTFFESLAASQGSRAIGIILSGNGSDGNQGLRAIKAECGITFAQDESSARFGGMPRSAVATGAVDFVLSPDQIGRELGRLGSHPYLVPPRDEPSGEVLPDGDRELKKIFALLSSATKVDFALYKPTTIRRRISRRMIVQRSSTLSEYLRYIELHPAEINELYKDLLITVTNFFREPDTFAAVISHLRSQLQGSERSDPFRVWVPGCATGEEVYSLAILLNELLHDLELDLTLQLFGTDISEVALDRARSGTYPESITVDVSKDRLQRYFTKVDAGYQISKTVRECCIFARQDITRDPPFSNIDWISCRNVLIYMDNTLQRRVLPVFQYSLKPSGVLILGTAESTAASPDAFRLVNKQHRIYARNPVPVRMTLDVAAARNSSERSVESTEPRPPVVGMDLYRKADRVIQSKYSPDSVLIDSNLQILQFRGHAAPYFDPSPGEASLNLLRMVREYLVLPLRRAVQAAKERRLSVRENAIGEVSGSERREINIEVTPIMGVSENDTYFLIVFESSPAPVAPPDFVELTYSDSSAAAGETDVKRELAETQEYLRNLREDYEAHAEELRAANEEVRSSNEELQSANEELSTAKEELQSANEELTTVNEELRNRNQELTSVNNDLLNLLTAVSLPIIMVDQQLGIRRFTVLAGKLMELSSADIGRPIHRIRGHIETAKIAQHIRSVLETLSVYQEEVQDDEGHWYRMTVRPYRTVDNRIDGAVLIFLDIDALKRSLRAAEEARDYAEGMIETVHEPLIVLDSDLRVQRATAAFYETFQVSRGETIGRFIYDIGNGQWNNSRLRELLGNALFRNEPFQDFELDHNFPHLGERKMRLNGRRIPLAEDHRRMVLLAIEDITERLAEAELRYRRIFETAKDAIVIIDPETGTLTDVNPFFTDLTGFQREDLIGRPLTELRPFQQAGAARDMIADCLKHDTMRYPDVALLTRSHTVVTTEIVANHYMLGTRPVIQANLRDITARKGIEAALRESEHRFSLFIESVRDYAMFQTDPNGRIISWNSGAERVLGYPEDEILGEPVARVFTPEDVANNVPEQEMGRAMTQGKSEDERWHLRKDGTRFFASGVLTTVRDEAGELRGYAKVMRDVTSKRFADERLKASLREKEVLLKEIHHRVKNNLQVITSLLNIQAHNLRQPDARGVLDDVRNRVHSIAAIHEMLYESADLSYIDFDTYLRRIANDLTVFHGIMARRIRVVTDAESVRLDIERAVPCGLITSELLTNALKHAFPDNREGIVEVHLRCEEDCELVISDNGVGLADDIDPERSPSMGLTLVQLLTQQIRGTIHFDRSHGTRVTIRFPEKAE